MYTYTPKHQNKKAQHICFALVLAAFALIFVGAIDNIPYPSIFQLSAMALLTVVVVIASRYLLRQLTYKIYFHDRESDYSAAGYDLEILEYKSKREVVVCKLAMSDLADVIVETPENKKEIKKLTSDSSARAYNYCIDIAPRRAVWLIFDDTFEGKEATIALKFTPDDKMLAILWEFKRNGQKLS